LRKASGRGTPAIAQRAEGGGQGDVVDFGIGAPFGAASDSDFEFAGKIVEVGITPEFLVESEGDGRDVGNFVRVESGEGAAGDVADDVAASASGAEADGCQSLEDFRERFDFEPVKLDILTNGDVGDAVAVFIGESGDGAELE